VFQENDGIMLHTFVRKTIKYQITDSGVKSKIALFAA